MLVSDRYHHHGRDGASSPVRHHSTRLPTAAAIQPHLQRVRASRSPICSCLYVKLIFIFLPFFSEDSKETPVMIHRAILGSVERFIAILCENYGGKWCVSLPWSLYSSVHVLISFGRPFWLSPRQAVVIPVAKNYEEYAKKVREDVYASGFMCDTDLDDSTTMNKKIRNGQLAQYNFIFGLSPTLAPPCVCVL